MSTKTKSFKPLQRILVKCGGFSTQLATHVGDCIDDDPLWSAAYDAKDEDAVVETHLDFLQNGAQIILSNTYQSSIEGFMEHLKLNEEESIQLMRKSIRLTKIAKQKFLEQIRDKYQDSDLPLILASIGPYGAHLHDGSEYNGSYIDRVATDKIQNWHRPRIDACLAEGVDGLAVETIPCQAEAEVVVDMILRDYPGVKFWVSFQCKNEKNLAHGEQFSDAVASIWKRITTENAWSRCLAIGVNCLHPRFVAPLFKSLKNNSEDRIPLIVYSNRGETFNKDTREWKGIENCMPMEQFVPEWIELGAVIIGGCCRVYPPDILKIRNCIDDINKS